MFHIVESVEVELFKRKRYKVDICIDFIDYKTNKYTPIIERLKDGESYSIHVMSSGCFHYTEADLIISRKNNEYYLKYKGVKQMLSLKEIEIIKKFEMELVHVYDYGCTSVDYYSVSYLEEEFSVIDGGCSWGGFYHLKKNLNLE